MDGALTGGVLEPRTRELVALAVAQTNSSSYCLASHSTTGEVVGLTADEALEARRGRAVDPKEAGAIHLALAILWTRGGVSDEALAHARAVGLSDAEISEVLAHVALNVFTNYFNRLADTEIDFPRVDARLPEGPG